MKIPYFFSMLTIELDSIDSAYSHLFGVSTTDVEPRIVGKWEHKRYKHLRDVPIYCFGQNTSK